MANVPRTGVGEAYRLGPLLVRRRKPDGRIGRTWWLALALLVIAATIAACASTQPKLAVEWQPRDAATSVHGRIVNRHSLPAREIRLLVEGLDADGRVGWTRMGYVAAIVRSGESVPFDVPIPAPAARYRVSVLSFQWELPPASPGRGR